MTTHAFITTKHRADGHCTCGSAVRHNDNYDTYYCLASGEWLEEVCKCPNGYGCPVVVNGDRPVRHII